MFSNAWLKEQSPQKLKQSPETQLGVLGCVAGTTYITTYLTKKLTSENYTFIQKSRVQKPSWGCQERSWDNGHHDITKKLTLENYIFIPKSRVQKTQLGGVRMRSWDHRHHDLHPHEQYRPARRLRQANRPAQ
jgi:hypothetical protein